MIVLALIAVKSPKRMTCSLRESIEIDMGCFLRMNGLKHSKKLEVSHLCLKERRFLASRDLWNS